MMDPEEIADIPVRRFDGASSWTYSINGSGSVHALTPRRAKLRTDGWQYARAEGCR